MKPALRALVASVVTASAIALAVSVFLVPLHHSFGADDLLFWVIVTLFASAAPVRLPRGSMVAVSSGAILAATFLGGPTAGAIVAAVGTTELREVVGRIPWYGTLYNHSVLVLPAIAVGLLFPLLAGSPVFEATPQSLVAAGFCGVVYLTVNNGLSAITIAVRDRSSVRGVIVNDIGMIAWSLLATAPIAWLMAHTYESAGGWAALLFGLPLYTTRSAYQGLVEVRNMFTQTVGSLASAVDAKDPYTAGHSKRVQEIAVDIGREMRGGNRCSEKELQALEWGGLLHDVGKIGVPDAVLLKQDKLTREERMIMNQHPVKGEEILKPVEKLQVERTIIRHHHEWYNGSGYPDHLIGEEIPKLARILHVADAFEAMTSARPYRMDPFSPQQAIAELRKYTGIQFDPEVVEAFLRTKWAKGAASPARPSPERPLPLLAQHAAMKGRAPAADQGSRAH